MLVLSLTQTTKQIRHTKGKNGMQTDTIKLLRECNAGIKMGQDAIKQVLPHVKSQDLKRSLEVCQNTHASLGDETHRLLLDHNAETKDAHPMARAMSNMKIGAVMMANESDNKHFTTTFINQLKP